MFNVVCDFLDPTVLNAFITDLILTGLLISPDEDIYFIKVHAL